MSAHKEITVIAKTNFHGQARLFGIKTDDRRRHVHVIGKTGMGKTSLLLNMAVSDIRNGRGMAFIDPHGDVAEDLLKYVPPERVDDVIYFNPQDLEYPLAFNVLGDVPRNQRHIVADGLVGVFKKIWADSWGPRLEYILRNSILTLLETEDSTLLDLMRILVDKDYRAQVVYQTEDPMLKSFWLNEFEGYGDKMMAEAIAPIQNKVGQFTSSPLIRNIIGQKKSSFNIREIMDNRKILLMNLSKGAVGEGGAQLLGAMMVTKMQLAAMSRVDIPQDQRQDFFLYIDEFQNFSTDSFAEILSEARKYRLSLILAHQYVEQLSEEVRAAVFGNVGTTIVFRIGAADAELFEKEFAPTLTIEDFVNLPKWKIYLKLMIDGVTSEPFSADTLPDPPFEEVSMASRIIEVSREKYGNALATFRDATHPPASPKVRTKTQNTMSSTAKKPSEGSKFSERKVTSLQQKSVSPKDTPKKESQTVTSSQQTRTQPETRENKSEPEREEMTDVASQPQQPSTQVGHIVLNTQNNSQPIQGTVVIKQSSPEIQPLIAQENPILAKKLREIFIKSESPFGESEYLIKAKVRQQEVVKESEDRIHISEFYDEILGELLDKLMKPNPDSIDKQERVREKYRKSS